MTDSAEIRKAYIDLVSNLIGIPGFDTEVPVDENPSQYFIITNPTVNPTLAGKALSSDNTGYRYTENRVFINLDLIVESDLGTHSSVSVEHLVEHIEDSVKRGLRPNGYLVKETRLVNVVPMHVTTETQHIQRVVLAFEHWVQKRNNYPGLIIDNNPAGWDWSVLYAPENMNRDWDMLFDCNDPGQSGCIYAPIDKCTIISILADSNPAEDSQHVIFKT